MTADLTPAQAARLEAIEAAPYAEEACVERVARAMCGPDGDGPDDASADGGSGRRGDRAMTEEWRPVPGLGGHYTVSNHGRVWSAPRLRTAGGIMRPRVKSNGYLTLVLSGDGERQAVTVHELVAEAFIGPRPEGQQVRHLDGDKTNNHAANLAYGTQSENEIDKLRHGTNLTATKPRCDQGHSLTDPANVRLYRGRRICRACQAAYRARRRQARDRFVCGAACTYGGLSVTRKHSNGDLGWMGYCNRPVMREEDRCFEHQSRAAVGAPATAGGDDRG